MDVEKRAEILRTVVRKLAVGGAEIQPDEWLKAVAAQNDGIRTGPEIGEKVPDFTLPDQSDRMRSLSDLTGPDGLLLVFSRSADW